MADGGKLTRMFDEGLLKRVGVEDDHQGQLTRTVADDSRRGRPMRTANEDVHQGELAWTAGEDSRYGRPMRTANSDGR